MQQAREHLERGGLARAVRPQEAHDLTRLDIEGNITDRLDVVDLALEEPAHRRLEAALAFGNLIGLGNPVDSNHRVHRFSPVFVTLNISRPSFGRSVWANFDIIYLTSIDYRKFV